MKILTTLSFLRLNLLLRRQWPQISRIMSLSLTWRNYLILLITTRRWLNCKDEKFSKWKSNMMQILRFWTTSTQVFKEIIKLYVSVPKKRSKTTSLWNNKMRHMKQKLLKLKSRRMSLKLERRDFEES